VDRQHFHDEMYGIDQVLGHNDYGGSNCPGANADSAVDNLDEELEEAE
jgi:hypothetical protein